MFELKPFSLDYTFSCPDCGCKFGQPGALMFQGIHVLADCLCECCENHYYHTLPTGHAVLFPVAFSQKTSKTRFDEKYASWLAKPLIASVRENRSAEKNIFKKVLKQNKEVILLNCLDNCFGHVFLKLLTAQKYLREYPGKGLVVLIPAGFAWMIPAGVSEIWEVEATLKDFSLRISNLDTFIKEEIKRFDSVLYSEVPVHPDLSNFDLKDFLKTEKFDLDDFEKKPFQITFILREDRFWLNNRLDVFLCKFAISKGFLNFLRKYFISKQNRLFKKFAAEIHKKMENKVSFFAAGIGITGSLGALVKDHRKLAVNEKIEKEWCELYASSHLVIGIHGSNMLIPSALSAGFIEILPRHKIYNLTEDIAMDRKRRYMQFLGRYLDEFSSVKLVAEHAVSVLQWFPVVKKNMEQ